MSAKQGVYVTKFRMPYGLRDKDPRVFKISVNTLNEINENTSGALTESVKGAIRAASSKKQVLKLIARQ